MSETIIRRAAPADMAALNAALGHLSAGMGDTHRASDAAIAAAAAGPVPVFHALLAHRDATVVGATLYSPIFSTTRGMPGAYVSDLWVDQGQRGQGLGVRLLAHARDAAREAWGAGFLRLAYYDDNPGAGAFYAKLGFAPMPGDIHMILEGPALEAVGRSR